MEENSSLASQFKFESYKIDHFNFTMLPEVHILLFNGHISPADWKYNIQIKNPTFLKSTNHYIGGVDFNMKIVRTENEKKTETTVVQLDASIAGVFKVNEKIPKDLEQSLVKVNIPTILMPFLRSAITSFFAIGGFGTVTIPLFNMVSLAQKIEKDLEIHIVE